MGRPTGAHVFGPLQPFVHGFVLELIELGYGWTVQVNRLRLMAELSAWMTAEGIEPAELSVSLIAAFVASFRAVARSVSGSRRRRSGSWWNICGGWGWCRSRSRRW